jgi:hypothetical protein
MPPFGFGEEPLPKEEMYTKGMPAIILLYKKRLLPCAMGEGVLIDLPKAI